MSNPEFRRNLWLSFTVHKLIAIPAILGMIFLTVGMIEHYDVFRSLYHTATTLFIFIVWIWGSINANSSIVDEFRDKTWDQQRMSAMKPWSMTWGKLFGATAINWYGGAFCLAVAFVSGILDQEPLWIVQLLTLATTGVLIHAALITLNLHSGNVDMKLMQRGGLGWIIILAATMLMFLVNIALTEYGYERPVTWWGLTFPVYQFLLGSALIFAACFTFAALRLVSNALQVRTLPWAWPLFGLFLTFYIAGFPPANISPFDLSHIGLVVAGIMMYATLFTEQTRLPDWNRLRRRQQDGDWRGWLETLPLWPTALLLAFCFAIPAATTVQPDIYHMLTNPMFVSSPLAFALTLLRDAAIVLFFSFSAKAKRPVAVALVYILLLHMLLPFLLRAAGLDTLSYIVLPVGIQYSDIAAALVMACQALIALLLVAWRLRKETAPKATRPA